MSSLYCGIDLHSNNHVVVVIDAEDKRLYEKRLPNDLVKTLSALEPFKEDLESTIVESTFNWYWLVDGLMDHGFHVELANPTACAQQYSGVKKSLQIDYSAASDRAFRRFDCPSGNRDFYKQ